MPTDGPSNNPQGGDVMQELNELREVQANEFRNVKLSNFWRHRPSLWFVTLESEFVSFGIHADNTKYTAVIRHLDEQTIYDVADILEAPPEADKYGKLKAELIKRFSDSLECQVRTLIKETELGDKKPSVLLREMQRLANNKIDEEVLKTLWVEKLPSRIQDLLSILEDIPLAKMAEYADKFHERTRKNDKEIAAASTGKQFNNQQFNQLNDRIGELEKKLASVNLKAQKDRQQKKFRPRSKSREKEPIDSKMCRFHRKFGEKAWNCILPCNAPYKLASPGNYSDQKQ